tara:strand:+ start:7554 stop:10175 length:2622 start_codon:yes stop_codon:yes gene_type:complete
MAERKRSRFWPFGGRDKTVAVPSKVDTDEDVNMKALASLSKIGTQTMPYRNKSQTANPDVSYELIRAISLKSEVVNAILRRTVDDTMGNGYRFDLAEGVEEGDPQQLRVLQEFFKTPNPDDMGNEWLESLIFDLTLFGDAYLELDGSADTSTNEGQDWNFGGNLVSIWNIPADTIRLVPAPRTPQPPNMAYIQEIRGDKRRFTSTKVLHISKYKQGRAYGSSPLIPLLNTIAGHLNLSNYINEMFTGTLPKTILNVGDISNAEMKTMLAMLEQQLSTGKSPFGLVAVNGGSGFQTHRLIDSVKDGQHLDLLYYYREEICAVFGIPPMKLGWVQTGKMSNPETQLDSWYDVVEAYQHRIESMINNKILPLLKATNYRFKFNTIRPSKEKIMADIIKAQGSGIAQLRQEGVISINEARSLLGLERIDSQDADDQFFLSPKLTINQRQNSLDEWQYGEDEWVIKADSVSVGQYVSWRTEKGRYVGQVSSVITSGEVAVVSSSGGQETVEASTDNPVANVIVFVDNEDGTFSRSDRSVPVRVAMLRIIAKPETKQVSAKVRKTLSEKAKKHNESVTARTKKTTTRTLVAVFRRGVGAYQSNPQSVRPSVSSAEQWAYARVNSFLYVLKRGKFRGGKHDQDLLPAGHPQSTKSLEVEKGPACRQVDETYDQCVDRKIPELIAEDGFDSEQAVAAAMSMCENGCGDENSKRALTVKDRTPPQGVRDACKAGIKLFEDGFGGSGLEAATVREARAIARGEPVTVFKARKMIRWWGRNSRFLDEPKDSPAWTAAQLWGGRAGKSWASKLKRAIDAEERAAPEYVNNNECREDNETYEECISRGISYIMSREPDLSDEDAYAFAEQMCAIPCPTPDSDEDAP